MNQIYASAMGQYDNLGDTVLRRPFLEALRESGQLNVFVGNRPPEYLSALGLDGTERIFRNSKAWRRAVLSDVKRTGAIYAFNAGEIEVTRPYAAHYLRLMPVLLLNKLRGGRNIHVGIGIRQRTRWVTAVNAALALCDLVSWRDALSQETAGRGRVTPDWAFLEGASDQELLERSVDESRNTIVVAPRYNGYRLSNEWRNQIREVAEELGLTLVTLAQIERDNDAARELAAHWGVESILWQNADHATHEVQVRRAYAEARVVLSERLHALVIGGTEGAFPVALGHSPKEKAARTLAAAGFPPLVIPPTHLSATERDVVSGACDSGSLVPERVAAARNALRNLKEAIHELAH